MDPVTAIPMATLAVTAALTLAAAVFIARRLGRALNFRSLGLVNFAITNLVSGVVHLARLDGVSRGHYDATVGSFPQLDLVVYGNILGAIALTVACLRRLPVAPSRRPAVEQSNHRWVLPRERVLLIVATAVIAPLAWRASRVVRGFAQTSTDERIISLDDGLARFSFVSAWLVWVISFLAILAVQRSRSGTWAFAVTAAASLAIAWSLAWNGGRSIVLVMALPLVLVLLPRLRQTRLLAVTVGAAAIVYYFAQVTLARSVGQTYDALSLGSMFDWQWGRFSMLGMAGERVEHYGYMYGETFFAGVGNTATALLGLIGIGDGGTALRTSTQVAGETIMNTALVNYIVPGLSAELFLNFGWLGLLFGYYLLGVILGWVDGRFTAANGAILQLLWAYVGTLLVFRTVNADSASFVQYLAYTGAPLVLLALLAGRRNQAEESPVGHTPVPRRAAHPSQLLRQ